MIHNSAMRSMTQAISGKDFVAFVRSPTFDPAEVEEMRAAIVASVEQVEEGAAHLLTTQ